MTYPDAAKAAAEWFGVALDDIAPRPSRDRVCVDVSHARRAAAWAFTAARPRDTWPMRASAAGMNPETFRYRARQAERVPPADRVAVYLAAAGLG